MTDVYEILKEQALKKTTDFSDADFTIRGLWKVDLAFKPTVDERTFKYWFLVSQTVGQGSCYCDQDLVVDESLIGRDAREIIPEKDCYSISVLDSIYASIKRHPHRVHEISGNSIEKTAQRNAIILNEVEYVLGGLKPKGEKPRIMNVGVLGTLIKSLTEKEYSVAATDLDDRILNTRVHGVMVENGSKNFQLIPESDVVVITGMALTTDALGDIIDVCKQHRTRIVIFAETGAHFGEEYCRTLGADSVVSEPFPFYIFQGVSRIEIYRR
jgi:hypothetical protein